MYQKDSIYQGSTADCRNTRLPGFFLPAIAILLASSLSCNRASQAKPDIILIVFDTARADRFPPHRPAFPSTPNLAALAREGHLFTRAYSTSSWTVPSHASLFTGLFPISHQATQETRHLADDLETLAELLNAAGYETAAFSNNPWVSDRTNLLQGFTEVHEMWTAPKQRSADGLPHPTNERVQAWLSARVDDRPFFLFVNYMEPHWPYVAMPAYQAASISAETLSEVRRHPGNFRVADWYMNPGFVSNDVVSARRDLYSAEIAYLDAIFGELRAGLESLGSWDRSLIVVTSDHGEHLGENGHQGHNFALYDSTVRIPLFIRPAGAAAPAEARDDPAQLTDLFTTILAAAAIPATDPRIEAIDLLSRRAPDDRAVLAEYYLPEQAMEKFPRTKRADRVLAPFRRRMRSLQVGNDKLIWGSDGKHELYDVKEDPGERTDLVAPGSQPTDALMDRLEALIGRLRSEPVHSPERQPMDEKTEEALRSLGYVQ